VRRAIGAQLHGEPWVAPVSVGEESRERLHPLGRRVETRVSRGVSERGAMFAGEDIQHDARLVLRALRCALAHGRKRELDLLRIADPRHQHEEHRQEERDVDHRREIRRDAFVFVAMPVSCHALRSARCLRSSVVGQPSLVSPRSPPASPPPAVA
jgi:hypothetical protein